MDEIAKGFVQFGPPGLICIVLWIMLIKSEKREEGKDERIKFLEAQLVESYDERIADAARMSQAIHDSALASNNAAKALETLSIELRSYRNERFA